MSWGKAWREARRLAEVLLVLNRPAETRAQFEAGLATAPLYVFLHYNAALAADRMGEGEGALAHFRALVARAPRRLAMQRTEADKRIAALSARSAGWE